MKTFSLSSLVVFLVLAFSTAMVAQESGPSTNGDFQFATGGNAKALQFHARIHNNGSTSGEIVMSGGEALPDQDVDGGGDANPGGTHANLSMTIEVECLKINGNRAVMSGEVTDSSVGEYIGLRSLLVVEDGGEGSKKGPDRFVWGLYRPRATGWVPTDAELAFDEGAGMNWFASDFEREDDVPVSSHPDMSINCNSFPLGAYDLIPLVQGAGNIQVKP